jgi:hypothetical protein
MNGGASAFRTAPAAVIIYANLLVDLHLIGQNRYEP